MKKNKKRVSRSCCPPKQSLLKRALISTELSEELAEIFKMLANDSRLRLLHAIVSTGELSVSALAETVGMKTAAVSNQLQRLSDRGIVGSRRKGNNIFYRMVDPCVLELLDKGLCLTEDARRRS
ncbi:MAG TPA: metalloregulator ArsR/SmtB family transcription factor [Verrucomicrobiae bacterium]|nr:metalloregulator ArsR/SmtB family transcription factor [Verrucomicrobiae bacterium]